MPIIQLRKSIKILDQLRAQTQTHQRPATPATQRVTILLRRSMMTHPQRVQLRLASTTIQHTQKTRRANLLIPVHHKRPIKKVQLVLKLFPLTRLSQMTTQRQIRQKIQSINLLSRPKRLIKQTKLNLHLRKPLQRSKMLRTSFLSPVLLKQTLKPSAILTLSALQSQFRPTSQIQAQFLEILFNPILRTW